MPRVGFENQFKPVAILPVENSPALNHERHVARLVSRLGSHVNDCRVRAAQRAVGRVRQTGH